MEDPNANHQPSWVAKALAEIRNLSQMLKPLTIYTCISVATLFIVKITLSSVVVDRNDGMPYSDETKSFGFFTFLMPRIVLANFYAKKKLWLNAHLDHFFLVTPLALYGPLVWALSNISFKEAALYGLFFSASMVPIVLTPLTFWVDGAGLVNNIKLCLMQYAVFWSILAFNMAMSLVFLALSTRDIGGTLTIVSMTESVLLFGVGFPLVRFLSIRASRIGIKLYQFKIPTNAQEENIMKKVLFTFTASQEIFWNTLAKLLLLEIRNNSTFAVSVICSHAFTILTQFISAAAFKKQQRDRNAKTSPIASQQQSQQVDKVDRKSSNGEISRNILSININVDTEELPPYLTIAKSRLSGHAQLALIGNAPNPNCEPNLASTEPLFTPMSEEAMFAFRNLASTFAEWCGRISAFFITLLLTSSPPQAAWTQCREKLSFETHLSRGAAMLFLSFTADMLIWLMERRIVGTKMSLGIAEFQKTNVSVLVYAHMALMACSLCGVFIMVMPGMLENGNTCFRHGRLLLSPS
ncbi:hypothetical protein BC829DRAFT_400912 [Chytridium lagenaria]|nr:hypothetical protein BC829DRAFT_400912 [Chytridium lagenaria]